MLRAAFYTILKKPFFGRFMVKWKNPLTEKEMSEWKKVEVKSKSGAIIKGLYADAATTKSKATIVLAHPMGKEAKGYFIKNGYTELLRKNGLNTLIFDINGFGESSCGNFSYYEDIVAISKIAKDLNPHLPVGYHGISLGGQWATIAFADENHKYNFAIIESAATTLEEFWILFPMAYKMLKFLYFLLPKYKKQIKMIDRIKEAKNLHSLLFIYSNTDTWTPIQMGERFKRNCNVNAELWTVAQAKHAMIMKSTYKEEYENKIINFFENAVKNTSHN